MTAATCHLDNNSEPQTNELQLTCVNVDHTIWVAGGNKAILYQKPLVVVGTVIDEGLLITLHSSHSPDLVACGHMIEACRHLEENSLTLLWLEL